MSQTRLSLTEELRQQEYDQRQKVKNLQRAVYEQNNQSLLADLLQAQTDLSALECQISDTLGSHSATRKEAGSDLHLDQQRQPSESVMRNGGMRNGGMRNGDRTGGITRSVHRSSDTTGLEVNIHLHMKYVPTSIYHLLDGTEHPLLECCLQTSSTKKRRLRISSYIEGYTAQAIKTIEFSKENDEKMLFLPTFFQSSIQHLHELTKATVNVLAEDLDNGKIETHKTEPVWLLSRNSVPLTVRNPHTGGLTDLSKYLGAFVTPNQPDIMSFLREVSEHHPEKRLAGYADNGIVTEQVKAIFDALKHKTGISYVNSLVHFNPEEGANSQRVRLPRESLKEKQANCIDGTLLFASLLEAISLNPAIVIVPEHALIGWELGQGTGQWQYLETTMLHDREFDEALKMGGESAKIYEEQQNKQPERTWFRRLSLRELRAKHHITPME
ncbi:MAG: hypothetical protein GY862_10010 [Gammaproteobacteria bacterium]|nr:hypothetical protein [Gammaproteobacteria bacterium]